MGITVRVHVGAAPQPHKDLACPACGKVLRVKLADVRLGGSATCACGHKLGFRGDDGARAQQAPNSLYKTVGDFGRRLR
jgi:hypothetical protein